MPFEEPTLKSSPEQKSDEELVKGMTVSYEVNGYASIHYHPDPALGRKAKLAVFEDGLDELARRMKGRTDIRYVAATSWVVAANEPFFTRRKFVITTQEQNPEVEKLVREYKRRRDETDMTVPEEHKKTEPKVALLSFANLEERLNSRGA
ncbi:MAG: hypothetical protein RIQ56_207 [Candidatus Parcubacteria bacterium]|jgi:hypothetical protein